MIRLFCGYEAREAAGFHAFVHSIVERASESIFISPLNDCGLRAGSNAFTCSRFLVPQLCGYAGHAIFCDGSDMLALEDIASLDALFDPAYAVQVVKHPPYVSAHERKYIGTELECDQSNYTRKNWASVMLMNCEHPAWQAMDVRQERAIDLLTFRGLPDDAIGSLPAKWNVLVDEGQDSEGAALLHWTAGIPGFWHYQNARRAQDWFTEYRKFAR